MVSIKDVAETAGVSTATVSRVLADKPHVRGEVRDHVLAVVEALNYRPNRVARSLRAQKSNIIGLIVSDIQNPFFTLISRAVEDAAYEQGMSIFLCNTDENPDKEAMYLKLMREEHVSGIIISPTQKTSNHFVEISRSQTPVVVIDRRVRNADIDSVLIDNVQSALMIIDHLIGHGFERIGALFGSGSTTGLERREGYLRALENHGLKPSSELVLSVKAKTSDGYAATRRLLALPVPPDAIFTSNGLLSAGALRALRESGLKMPEEIAFATFDETPWSTLVDPPLTVVEQPTYEIGRTAVDLLVKRIGDPSRSTREVILKSKLIVRQSCGCHQANSSNE
jgi:LacI family transcriptional regulator, fructose operon transcriptional repressor